MKYIKKFNENNSVNSKIEEVEFNDDMMITTLTPLSISRSNMNILNEIGKYIIDNLKKEVIESRIHSELLKYFYNTEKPFEAFNFFTTSLIDHNDLNKMFNNVVIHGGSDGEDEYVSAIKIDGILTLILHSPDRGSQLRFLELISDKGMFEIYKALVDLYNKKLS